MCEFEKHSNRTISNKQWTKIKMHSWLFHIPVAHEKKYMTYTKLTHSQPSKCARIWQNREHMNEMQTTSKTNSKTTEEKNWIYQKEFVCLKSVRGSERKIWTADTARDQSEYHILVQTICQTIKLKRIQYDWICVK